MFKKIAEELGVELGEEFKVRKGEKAFEDLFFFSESGLCTNSSSYLPSTLLSILTGEFTIVKLPFKPNFEEPYYYITGNIHSPKVLRRLWKDTVCDYEHLKANNVFRDFSGATKAIEGFTSELLKEV